MHGIRKIVCAILACLLACMAAGCAGGPSEEEVRAIITKYEGLEKYGMEIAEYSLHSQRGSTVSVSVTARNDDLEYSADYEIECMEKDGRWVGHKITRENEAYTALDIMDSDRIVEDMMEQYGDLILYEGLRDIEVEITESETIQEKPGDYPQIAATAHCTARNDAYAYAADIAVKYELSPRNGWHCMYVSMENMQQSPLN